MTCALPDFGAIIVTVDTKDGVPVSARTRSTRGPMVSKLLEGRQADESIPTLISMLYTLCPVAKSTAWRAARAYAEGGPTSEDLAKWAAGVQLEAMIEHLRCLAFELPRSLDIESRSDAKLIGRLRTRVTGVSRLSQKELEALRKDVADCANELLYQTEDIPTLGDWRPTDQVETWVDSRSTVLRPVFSYLLTLPWELGRSSVPALSTASAAVRKDLAAHLTREGFCTAPSLTLGSAQTSALGRRYESPALMPEYLANGAGTFLYFYARLLELGSWMQSFEEPEKLVSGFSPEPGVGIGFVETARGTLIHRLRIENGKMIESTIVAPTEWNFAPGGAAEQALSRLGVTNWDSWRTRAELVVRQFDACVPFRIETESANA